MDQRLLLQRKTRGLWHTPNSIKAPYNRNGLISYKQAAVVSYPRKEKSKPWWRDIASPILLITPEPSTQIYHDMMNTSGMHCLHDDIVYRPVDSPIMSLKVHRCRVVDSTCMRGQGEDDVWSLNCDGQNPQFIPILAKQSIDSNLDHRNNNINDPLFVSRAHS
jgi:hypothetical protein